MMNDEWIQAIGTPKPPLHRECRRLNAECRGSGRRHPESVARRRFGKIAEVKRGASILEISMVSNGKVQAHLARSLSDVFGNGIFGATLLGHQPIGFVAVRETLALGIKEQLLVADAERDIAQVHQAGA